MAASRAQDWDLKDGELWLELSRYIPGDSTLERAPSYHFVMRHQKNNACMGDIELRLGTYSGVRLYSGHLGYEVYPAFRGNYYAARSCKLLLPVAAHLGLDEVWITCNPENIASRKTCERLGATFVEIVEIPPYINLYARGDRHKCRYRLDLRQTES